MGQGPAQAAATMAAVCDAPAAPPRPWRVLPADGVVRPCFLLPRDQPPDPPGTSQSPPDPPRASPDEWMFGLGIAQSIDILQSTGGRHYLTQTVSWGRELTRGGGPQFVRGRFVWAIEAMPVFGQFDPTHVYGAGVSPLLWRWNFDPRGRFAPYAELATGGLWTTKGVPEGTQTANFTAIGGFGMRWLISPHRAVALAYRFHHISNGNQSGTNPGVNSHVVWVGLSRR